MKFVKKGSIIVFSLLLILGLGGLRVIPCLCSQGEESDG